MQIILKNLLRRKTRTVLTILGICVGVTAIIVLGALANGLKTGYGSMMSGSKADLVLSQPDTLDVSYSAVDEKLGADLAAMPEVDAVSGMIQGITQAEGEPLFIIFGYAEDSFLLERFQVLEGVGLYARSSAKQGGKPVLLGSAAANLLKKDIGDSLRIIGSIFRIVGIFETGDIFEDSAALLQLKDAQQLLGKNDQVSLFYIRLAAPGLRARLEQRITRDWPDLSLAGTTEFADKQSMQAILQGFVWVIGGLAIVIGGVGMLNAQLMAVFERTREIGILRALGWKKQRVMGMILGESVLVCLAGGMLGIFIGWALLNGLGKISLMAGLHGGQIKPVLIAQALMVVFTLGLVGGLYPAWRAARLTPLEALRYESGSSRVRRLPVGGLAVQNLWQRSTRSLLTLGTIGLTVGAILAMDAVVRGFVVSFTDMASGTQAEIMVRQRDVADVSLSAIDEKVMDTIRSMPAVRSVSGVVFTAVLLPDTSIFFLLQGYSPHEFAINRLHVIEGQMISGNRQIILGSMMAEALKKEVGDMLEVSGMRFRIVGIYESNIGWEQTGGVITLRDAQNFVGRPRQLSMIAVKVSDVSQARIVAEQINARFPAVSAGLSSEFAEEMPDIQNSRAILNGISLMAVVAGGLSVLNTMLMSVFERTREIGVLRALGWRRQSVLGLILQEAVILGLTGGLSGIVIAFGLIQLMMNNTILGSWVDPAWTWDIFVRAILLSILLGAAGGLYPAYSATRLRPVEALRYE